MPAASTARGGLLVSAGIVASRLVGLVRQRVVAHHLGTSDAADALAAAFRVGNITQNLLGEGALSASFVPVYVRLREAGGSRASSFARAALGALLPVAFAVSALGVLAAPTLAGLVGSGFTGDKLALTASLVRVLFPMTGVLVVGAWALGVLTSHQRLFLPYAAPVLWSVAQVVAVVIAASRHGVTREGLALAVAWGALAGAALQVLVMLGPVRSLLGSVMPRFDLDDPAVREAASKLPGSLMGRGVMQLSALLDTAMVGTLGAGALASVTYAQTIYLLPMALLGTGEAAAALPELSKGGALDDARKDAIRASLAASLARIVPLAAGATTAFLATGTEITTLLLRGGQFNQGSTHDVTRVLAAYALALPANAVSRMLATACYALGDTTRPARYATARVVVSTLCSLALLRPLGAPGVVLGSVVGAWVELGLLAVTVRDTIGGVGTARVPFGPLLAACAVCASLGAIARYFAVRAEANVYLSAALVLALAGGGFVAACGALGVADLRALLRRRRGG